MVSKDNIILTSVKNLEIGLPKEEPVLPDSLYQMRLEKVLGSMKSNDYEYLLIYADREHYSNFDFVAGFDPRFEEALLVLRKDGRASCLLGNECLNLHKIGRIPMEGILYQAFSLPGQPIDKLEDLTEILKKLGIVNGDKVGIVGWKLMYPRYGTKDVFDVPAYLVDAARRAVGSGSVENATDLFIHPAYGVRIVNTADDIALYEFGAAYASETLKDLIDAVQPGMTELEASCKMQFGGLPLSCHPLTLSGERCDRGLVSPTTKVIELGDRFNCSNGLRGGLSCRTGFMAESEKDLPDGAEDYLDVVAKPYYATVVNWYEMIGIGVHCADLYRMVQDTYPKEKYGWVLNPGHLVSTEEWLSSPIAEDSDVVIRSGMCFQMDIIPAPPKPYAGANCEDGLAIADEELRNELKEKYPEVWKRIELRRKHMMEVLGIQLKPEILPLSNLAATYRPYFMAKDKALVCLKGC